MPSSYLPNHPTAKAGFSLTARTGILVALSGLLGMSCYEFFKLTVAPDLTIWKFDLGAVVFGSLIATFAAYFILPRYAWSESIAPPQIEKQLSSPPTEVLPNEAHYRQLFDSNPQPMWVDDLATEDFLVMNEAAV